jgi:NADH dehydrogenase (ubiquinone) 1 alpha subcomplex subunit 8|tara:strand:+ start:1902 stop:2207 length:306 start_codon:yes stop_codon:yes gene_type:complete|mmetsp:Transcript_2640/g.10131  ORF Transcript_2640/g.10131 Transcript_2640/m.10131 type:complete len:102 (-) Transcript_2640:118-423(-)|eukprot:CAMPEP_0119207798 /NCGR_PEP_ID=MMETSP1327-20130426/205_1 /TAXON_ID=38833 /ORGANISM="Micromonas pusilla, Strain RCC2306" /LENGTH=101 /DNA_ID=CAMNT_0007204217 /DNA_START=173 /DNA_END=478 /DNA_ORIENTATION=+
MSGADDGVATSSVLFAVHKHLQLRCAQRSAAYLACKKNNQDPAACLEEGAKVTGCMIDLLKELKGKCPASLNQYAECLDYRSNKFAKCRVEQGKFEEECPL